MIILVRGKLWPKNVMHLTDTCGMPDNCTAVVIHNPATCTQELSKGLKS